MSAGAATGSSGLFVISLIQMEVCRAPARPQKCVIVQSVACGTRAVLEHNNMYVIWSLQPLCIALKLLFLKKSTVFLVFTFASTFLICGRKLQFIELKWSRQFPHNNQIFFCKKPSCHTEQHLFGCPLGGATLATVSIMNPCLLVCITQIHKSRSLNIVK